MFALVVGLAMMLGASVPAWAQQEGAATTTVMGGYSFLNDKSWAENLPLGWVAAISQRIGERASIVGEAGGSYGKYGNTNFTIERYAFLGGVKFQGGEGIMPFVQIMAGLSRQAGDVGVLNGFAFQPGGGVDLRLTDRLSARGFADYRWIHEDGTHWNQFRVGGGIVYNLRH